MSYALPTSYHNAGLPDTVSVIIIIIVINHRTKICSLRHVWQLSPDTPAHKALHLAVLLRQGTCPDASWRRPLVVVVVDHVISSNKTLACQQIRRGPLQSTERSRLTVSGLFVPESKKSTDYRENFRSVEYKLPGTAGTFPHDELSVHEQKARSWTCLHSVLNFLLRSVLSKNFRSQVLRTCATFVLREQSTNFRSKRLLSFLFGVTHAPFACQRWGLPHRLAQCPTPGKGLV